MTDRVLIQRLADGHYFKAQGESTTPYRSEAHAYLADDPFVAEVVRYARVRLIPCDTAYGIAGGAGRPVQPGDWLASLTPAERKECAVEKGFYAYFPDAIALVARHSVRSNAKHNPGQPVHWSREKSTDQGDCIARHHLALAVNPDAQEDGQYEIISRAWRALADLQLWAEDKVRKGVKI